MKKIAILQSNYIPWKGYFDLIDSVDEFYIYDIAQYTKNDWRNRNQIKTENGIKWLTIPIKKKGSLQLKIKEVVIADDKWALKHLNIIEHVYKKSHYFDEVFPYIESLYEKASFLKHLSEINVLFITGICEIIDIKTAVFLVKDEQLLPSDRNEKLVSICLKAQASRYLSGPSAKEYLDTQLFEENGIEIEWMSYKNYTVYDQLYGDFVHNVSILDVLFNVGIKDAKSYIKKSHENKERKI